MKDKIKEFREKNPILDFAVGFIPGIGEAQDAHDFVYAANKKDIAGMSWALLGLAIPGLAGGQLKKLAKFRDDIIGDGIKKVNPLIDKLKSKGWKETRDGALIDPNSKRRFVFHEGKLTAEDSIKNIINSEKRQSRQIAEKKALEKQTKTLKKLEDMGFKDFNPILWFAGRHDISAEDIKTFTSHLDEYLDIAKRVKDKTLIEKSDGWYGLFGNTWKKVSPEDYIVSLSSSFKKSGLEWDGITRYNALRREAYDTMKNGKDIANWTTTNGAQGAIFAVERNNGPLLRNVVGRDSKHAHNLLDKSQAYQEINSRLPGVTEFNGAIEYGTNPATGGKHKGIWKIFGSDMRVKAIRGNNGNFDMSKAHPYLGIIPPVIGLITYNKYVKNNSDKQYN